MTIATAVFPSASSVSEITTGSATLIYSLSSEAHSPNRSLIRYLIFWSFPKKYPPFLMYGQKNRRACKKDGRPFIYYPCNCPKSQELRELLRDSCGQKEKDCLINCRFRYCLLFGNSRNITECTACDCYHHKGKAQGIGIFSVCRFSGFMFYFKLHQHHSCFCFMRIL